MLSSVDWSMCWIVNLYTLLSLHYIFPQILSWHQFIMFNCLYFHTVSVSIKLAYSFCHTWQVIDKSTTTMCQLNGGITSWHSGMNTLQETKLFYLDYTRGSTVAVQVTLKMKAVNINTYKKPSIFQASSFAILFLL